MRLQMLVVCLLNVISYNMFSSLLEVFDQIDFTSQESVKCSDTAHSSPDSDS